MQTFLRTASLLLPFVLCGSDGQTQHVSAEPPYLPVPENLSAREAFRDDQFGIFIHWGVYSVLGRGEWAMNNEKISIQDYEPLAASFNPVQYDPDQWVQLFKRAGAKYITITSKHHDGFCLWNSRQTDWDVVDRTSYGKDLLKPLAAACERHGIKLFFYHSQLDWHHPDYFPRGRTGHASGRPESGDFHKYIDFMNAQLSELLGGEYGAVAGIWFDGWWDQQSKGFEGAGDVDVRATRVDWRLRETYDLIHRLQPTCLVGSNHHVAPFDGEDFQMFERDLPGANSAGFNADSTISRLPLETCDTLNGNWGYNASDKNFKSVRQCVHYLVNAAGRNANLLLNIGPLPDGTIDPESAARLEGVGQWLARYEPTVRPTRGGPVAPQSWGVTTSAAHAVYVHVLDASAANPDGWLTLSGTQELAGAATAYDAEAGATQIRRAASGDLEVKAHWPAELIDLVLVVNQSPQ